MALVTIEVDGKRTEYELGISQIIKLAKKAAELTAEYQGHPQAKEEMRKIIYVPYGVPVPYPYPAHPYTTAPPFVVTCGSSSFVIRGERTT